MTEICYDGVLEYNIKYISMTGEYVSRRMKKKNETIKKTNRLRKRFRTYGHSIEIIEPTDRVYAACVRCSYLRKF